MNTKTNNDQHLENMLTIKTTVETCMDIQYIPVVLVRVLICQNKNNDLNALLMFS